MIDLELLATVTGGFNATAAELQAACNKGMAKPGQPGQTQLQKCFDGVADFAASKQDESWRAALQSVLDSKNPPTTDTQQPK